MVAMVSALAKDSRAKRSRVLHVQSSLARKVNNQIMVGCLKVIKSPDENEKCRTFLLDDQDHTLGNALRYIIMKNPQVKFCGYAIPHPSERKVHLRIETYDTPAVEALKKGLADLHSMCDHMLRVFESTVEKHKAKVAEAMET
ncbi:RNA polymerases I and III subunit AC2 l(2)37Cg [Haemaphysalis longicornis]